MLPRPVNKMDHREGGESGVDRVLGPKVQVALSRDVVPSLQLEGDLSSLAMEGGRQQRCLIPSLDVRQEVAPGSRLAMPVNLAFLRLGVELPRQDGGWALLLPLGGFSWGRSCRSSLRGDQPIWRLSQVGGEA